MLPPKALFDHAVGEAHAHVQGESLKACAAFLVRLLNSPATAGRANLRTFIIAATFVAGLGFAGAASAECSATQHGEHTSNDYKERTWMQKGKASVREKLKDGDSARFKDVFFCRGERNLPMTCGMVNAKNSFGAYGGFERFVSAGRPSLTYLESEVDSFGNVWDQTCR